MASLLVANTPDALAKQLRRLCALLSDLPVSSISETSLIFRQCVSANAVASISDDQAPFLIKALVGAISSIDVDTRTLALRVAIHAVRALPPRHLCQHCNTLTRAVLSCATAPSFASSPVQNRAQVLTALSALIAAAAPLVRLGPSYHSNVVTACVTGVRCAIQTLQTLNTPATLALPSLSILISSIVTAPRELRASLPDVEALLHDRYFIHGAAAVRIAASTLFAHLSVVCPSKLCASAFSGRLVAVCCEIDHLRIYLSFYSRTMKSKSMAPISKSLLSKTGVQLSFLADSLLHCLTSSLVVRPSFSTSLPITAIIQTLCASIIPRPIDLLTVPEQDMVSGEDALVLACTLSSSASHSLIAVLRNLPRDILLPHTRTISSALRNRMESIFLESREEDCKVDVNVPLRTSLYKAVEAAVTLLGSGVVDEIAVIFGKMFQKDVALRMRLHSVGNVSDANIKAAPKLGDVSSRKRKRRPDHVQTDSVKNGALLKGIEKCSSQNIEEAFSAAVSVCTAMFNCRGILSAKSIKVFSAIEALLMRSVEEGVVDGNILMALAASAGGGGSNISRAEASPILDQTARFVGRVIANSGSQVDARRAGFCVRALCESLIHPRGLPMRNPASRTSLDRAPLANPEAVPKSNGYFVRNEPKMKVGDEEGEEDNLSGSPIQIGLKTSPNEEGSALPEGEKSDIRATNIVVDSIDVEGDSIPKEDAGAKSKTSLGGGNNNEGNSTEGADGLRTAKSVATEEILEKSLPDERKEPLSSQDKDQGRHESSKDIDGDAAVGRDDGMDVDVVNGKQLGLMVDGNEVRNEPMNGGVDTGETGILMATDDGTATGITQNGANGRDGEEASRLEQKVDEAVNLEEEKDLLNSLCFDELGDDNVNESDVKPTDCDAKS